MAMLSVNPVEPRPPDPRTSPAWKMRFWY